MADAKTIAALREALDDEYKARATYRKIVEVFGPVRPFANIVEAEDRHVRALMRQFDRLGLKPPVDTWPTRVTAPRSLTEACEDAVQAEIDNAAMYERLIAQTSDATVHRTMRRLAEASQQRHLPAFKRCLSRTAPGSGAGGPGRGRRQAHVRRPSRTTSTV